MAGSDHSGQDMESGRTNRAEDQTRIWAQREGDGEFNGDVIFVVEAAREIEDETSERFRLDFTRLGVPPVGVRD